MKIRFYLKYIKRLFVLEKSHTYMTIASVAVGVAILGATLILGQSISDSAIKSAQIIHGGDLVAIGLNKPFTTKYLEKAKELKNKNQIKGFTVQANISDIARSSKGSRIAASWFIDKKYPLYGPALRSQKPKNANVQSLLKKGIVVSEKLADGLDIKVGDKLKLGLEPKWYEVTGIINNTVGQANDARMTGFLIRSMKQYQTAIKYNSSGQKQANRIVTIKLNKLSDMTRIRNIMKKSAARYTYLQPLSDVVKQIKSVMAIYKKGLVSFGFLSLLMVGVGISYTTRLWARRRLRDVAILKALGLKIKDIKLLFVLALALFSIIGTLIGTMFSFGIAFFLKEPIQTFFGVNAQIGWFYPKEILLAALSTFLVITSFSSFSITTLSRALPLMSLRVDEGSFPKINLTKKVLIAGLSIVLLILSTAIITSDLVLSAMLILATLAGGSLILLLLRIIFKLLPSSLPLGPNYKLAVKSLKSQGWLVPRTAMVVLVGILFMSLVLILAQNIKTNLTGEVRKKAGSDAIVLILANLEGKAEKQVLQAPNLKKAIRGVMKSFDLVSINGSKNRLEKLKNNINQGKQGYDPYIFEITKNVSLFDPSTFKPWQQIGKGRSLKVSDENKPVIVISNRIAKGLEVKLGETLDVESADRTTYLKVIGITENNSIISGLGEMMAPIKAFPKTAKEATYYYLSFKSNKAGSGIKWLNKNLKEASVLDVTDISASFGDAINSVRAFPLMLSMMALFASIVIIWSSITFSVIQRKRELAILKALGAKSKKIIWLLVNENLIVGTIGGILALIIVGIVTNVATEIWFKAPAKFNYFSLLGLLLIAVSIAVLSGILPAIRVARSKPLEVLRNE